MNKEQAIMLDINLVLIAIILRNCQSESRYSLTHSLTYSPTHSLIVIYGTLITKTVVRRGHFTLLHYMPSSFSTLAVYRYGTSDSEAHRTFLINIMDQC